MAKATVKWMGYVTLHPHQQFCTHVIIYLTVFDNKLSETSKHLITTSRYCSKWFRTLPNFVIFVFGFIEIKFLVLSKHALFIWACLLPVASNYMMTSYFLLLLCVFSCINFPFSFIILFLSFIWRQLDNIVFLVIMLLPCCSTPVVFSSLYFNFLRWIF